MATQPNGQLSQKLEFELADTGVFDDSRYFDAEAAWSGRLRS